MYRLKLNLKKKIGKQYFKISFLYIQNNKQLSNKDILRILKKLGNLMHLMGKLSTLLTSNKGVSLLSIVTFFFFSSLYAKVLICDLKYHNFKFEKIIFHPFELEKLSMAQVK
jgi:hypothetical protein